MNRASLQGNDADFERKAANCARNNVISMKNVTQSAEKCRQRTRRTEEEAERRHCSCFGYIRDEKCAERTGTTREYPQKHEQYMAKWSRKRA